MKNMVKKENSKVYSVLCKCTGNVQEAWGPERKKNDHFAIWIHEDWMTESTIDNQIRAEIEGGYYPVGNVEVVKVVNLPESNRIRKYERAIMASVMCGICPNG